MKKLWQYGMVAAMVVGGAAQAAAESRLVLTASNGTANQLLVYDASGALVQSVPTQGQGGVSGNAGGIAVHDRSVAVINFGSQSVSTFERRGSGFEFRQVIGTLSAPVSVAFGNNHLYVLGTSTIESHRIEGSAVDANADGVAALIVGDGSAAQVGVVGDELVISEKTGVVETVSLESGAVSGSPSALTLPADALAAPFGLVTRGSSAYVTVAKSDEVILLRNGQLVATAATGIPNGDGQHSPCWIAVVGPYLFSANSPSHSISRLVATGRTLNLDAEVAASVPGAPIDIASDGTTLAVIVATGGNAQVVQFRVDEDGNLIQTASTAIASAANGAAVVAGD